MAKKRNNSYNLDDLKYSEEYKELFRKSNYYMKTENIQKDFYDFYKNTEKMADIEEIKQVSLKELMEEKNKEDREKDIKSESFLFRSDKKRMDKINKYTEKQGISKTALFDNLLDDFFKYMILEKKDFNYKLKVKPNKDGGLVEYVSINNYLDVWDNKGYHAKGHDLDIHEGLNIQRKQTLNDLETNIIHYTYRLDPSGIDYKFTNTDYAFISIDEALELAIARQNEELERTLKQEFNTEREEKTYINPEKDKILEKTNIELMEKLKEYETLFKKFENIYNNSDTEKIIEILEYAQKNTNYDEINKFKEIEELKTELKNYKEMYKKINNYLDEKTIKILKSIGEQTNNKDIKNEIAKNMELQKLSNELDKYKEKDKILNKKIEDLEKNQKEFIKNYKR